MMFQLANFKSTALFLERQGRRSFCDRRGDCDHSKWEVAEEFFLREVLALVMEHPLRKELSFSLEPVFSFEGWSVVLNF